MSLPLCLWHSIWCYNVAVIHPTSNWHLHIVQNHLLTRVEVFLSQSTGQKSWRKGSKGEPPFLLLSHVSFLLPYVRFTCGFLHFNIQNCSSSLYCIPHFLEDRPSLIPTKSENFWHSFYFVLLDSLAYSWNNHFDWDKVNFWLTYRIIPEQTIEAIAINFVRLELVKFTQGIV